MEHKEPQPILQPSPSLTEEKKTIGMPKETLSGETRVGLTPDVVSKLVQRGYRVLIEKGVGKAAHISDESYRQAGGEVLTSRKDVLSAATIVKVALPSVEEACLMASEALLFSFLHPTIEVKETLSLLQEKQITAVNYNEIRGDDSDAYPIWMAMRDLDGRACLALGMNFSTNPSFLRGAVGEELKREPLKVLVVGAGNAGESAAKIFSKRGCRTSLTDVSFWNLQRMKQALSHHQIETALFSSQTFKEKLSEADIVILDWGTVSEIAATFDVNMLGMIKSDSLLIDTSRLYFPFIENAPQTAPSEIVKLENHGFFYNGYGSLSVLTPQTSSQVLGDLFWSLFLDLSSRLSSTEELLIQHPRFKSGFYLYQGSVVHQRLSVLLGIPCQQVDLFSDDSLA